MSPNFNINRPGVSDEEINKHKNFNELVERFKQEEMRVGGRTKKSDTLQSSPE